MVTKTQTTQPAIIGISGGSADSASVRAMMSQIRSTGAVPLFLGNHGNRDARKDIDKIDSLVVMGNDADIDPGKYGEAPGAHTNSELKTPQGKARAHYEEELLKLALEQKMPVLGVCAGMQRINVLLGGSLHQHVPDLVGHNEHAQQDSGIAPFVPVMPVMIDKTSGLGLIAGRDAVYVPDPKEPKQGLILENSLHHQSVKTLGNGLRASAVSDSYKNPDGSINHLIEAIEPDPNGPLKDQYLLGVQWHPEFGASPIGPRIAAHLATAAKEFARDHQRNHPMSEAVEETIKSALPQVELKPNAMPSRKGSFTDYITSQRAAQGKELSV
jgi:putative glutamine amidotransferase